LTRNLDEHGVDFLHAALIFENPVVEAEDSRSDYGEIRIRALGHMDDDYYLVVYTWRGNARRIISAWKVGEDGKTRKDIKRYSLEELKALRARGKTRTHADAPVREIDKDFWEYAHGVMPSPGKTSVHLRVDSDVLAWFRKQGRGHLSRMNAVLRSYVEAARGRR
jgi:uncharacterized protein (DUF4415 family)